MEQYNRNELVQPNTLVWGILSLAVPVLILNLIFGVIGRKKEKRFSHRAASFPARPRSDLFSARSALS